MEEQESPRTRPYRWFEWLALFSFGFNIIILIVLVMLRGMMAESLSGANQHLFETLQTLETYDGYQMPVHLTEEVTLDQSEEVLFEDTLSVPVSITVSVSQMVPFKDSIAVPINTVIPVADTVQAPLDIGGTRIFIDVPVELNVPVNMTVVAPVDTEVPIDMSIPLSFDLEVPVRELIPLHNRDGDPLTIGLDLKTQIPVPMDELLEDVGMLQMLEQLHDTLNVLESVLMIPRPSAR